ncbi:MAG: LysR family transcriptional regulator [Thalassobius sp.]|nr:LysR family transcriptional regulator [Thalassovita sp.]
MELRQIRYFLKAKELLNFTEAANSLFISQSTLSQQIKQLEIELDVLLFNRIGKRIALTEAGEMFAEHAVQSLNKANDGFLAMKDLNNLKTGKIIIGVTYGIRSFLTPALIEFSKKYPDIQVQVIFGISDELFEKLNQLELDFVLSFRESMDEEHFNYTYLFSSPMTFVTSDKSLIEGKETITLEEIAKMPLALPAKGFSTTKFINKIFTTSKLSPKISIEINDIQILLDIVKTGNWHTVLAQTTVSDVKELHAVPIAGESMTRSAMIISLKDVYEKKAVKVFCDILQKINSKES